MANKCAPTIDGKENETDKIIAGGDLDSFLEAWDNEQPSYVFHREKQT